MLKFKIVIYNFVFISIFLLWNKWKFILNKEKKIINRFVSIGRILLLNELDIFLVLEIWGFWIVNNGLCVCFVKIGCFREIIVIIFKGIKE